MDKFNQLYEQYALYKEKVDKEDSDFTINLLQYEIKEEYFLKVSKAVELLHRFYEAKLVNTTIRNAVSYKVNHNHVDNVIFCLLIDVLRCYDGLNHPTTFTTPEGVALMVLLDKMIGDNRIMDYGQLGNVDSATLSLIDLVPYLSSALSSWVQGIPCICLLYLRKRLLIWNSYTGVSFTTFVKRLQKSMEKYPWQKRTGFERLLS